MLEDKLTKLKSLLQQIPQADYPHQSRIHALKTFPYKACQCTVKRDDELGGLCGGSKMRKYRTLIPHLIQHGYKEVAVIGGAYSNNVLGVSQLLIQNGLKPVFFLRGERMPKRTGNALFSSLLVPPESIHWIPRQDWPQVLSIAGHYVANAPAKAFLLPEGASTESAWPGALTLGLDIIRNEEVNSIHFDHVVVEAGTGMMAAALILAFAWLEKATQVHVLLMAQTEEQFQETLSACHRQFERLLDEGCPFAARYHCYAPQIARSFGATNQQIFEGIKGLARNEGFFCDPIYSAKLFSESHAIIEENKLRGHILLVHSGGTFSLAGFQDKFLLEA